MLISSELFETFEGVTLAFDWHFDYFLKFSKMIEKINYILITNRYVWVSTTLLLIQPSSHCLTPPPPTLELRMIWAFMVAASWSWWSGLESQRCLSAGRELRASSVGQNMVNGWWMDMLSTGSNPASCTKRTQNKSVLASPNPTLIFKICWYKVWSNIYVYLYKPSLKNCSVLNWRVKTQRNRCV